MLKKKNNDKYNNKNNIDVRRLLAGTGEKKGGSCALSVELSNSGGESEALHVCQDLCV